MTQKGVVDGCCTLDHKKIQQLLPMSSHKLCVVAVKFRRVIMIGEEFGI